MLVITGAAGFIGSNLAARLNSEGFMDIVLVDDFARPDKNMNINDKKYTSRIHRDDFFEWLRHNHRLVQFIFHLGARTDTSEMRKEVFDRLNLRYSQDLWLLCVEFGLPLIYASSAATYGMGEHGFSDDHSLPEKLKPLNPYGESKNEFDKWVLLQKETPFFWAGLKFFNVYGPNEYHKGRMASVIFHAYNQILDTGKMKLFRSHNPGFPDGGQKRDFIYVKDVVDVIYYFMHYRKDPALYNLGTGQARSFLDLTKCTFNALGKKPVIEFIDTPEDIRDKYQYFTEATTIKLRNAGYNGNFTGLEEGINDYVGTYLKTGAIN